jgi:hypothetical protein
MTATALTRRDVDINAAADIAKMTRDPVPAIEKCCRAWVAGATEAIDDDKPAGLLF